MFFDINPDINTYRTANKIIQNDLNSHITSDTISDIDSDQYVNEYKLDLFNYQDLKILMSNYQLDECLIGLYGHQVSYSLAFMFNPTTYKDILNIVTFSSLLHRRYKLSTDII